MTGVPDHAVRVSVLMATKDGAAFLQQQLESLRGQSGFHIRLLVSDDRSTDDTVATVERFRRCGGLGEVEVGQGPCAGFSENFRRLIGQAPEDSEFYAFSDQDDVWHPDKLERAVGCLAAVPGDVAALYCGRTRLVDGEGRGIGFSPLFSRPPSFGNALVQNLAGGNTMVLNRAAFLLLKESARRTGFVSHDWWAYLLVTGAGGRIWYDPRPTIDYRQHGANLVGDNTRLLSRLRRVMLMLTGRYKRWTAENLASLRLCSDLLAPESRMVLEAFVEARKCRGLKAVRMLRDIGIYRQSFWGTIMLVIGAAIGKI